MLGTLALSVTMYAFQPIPREAARRSGTASTYGQNQRDTDSGRPKNSMAPINREDQSSAANHHGGKQANEDSPNGEAKVRVVSIPPISIEKDEKSWLDHAYDWGPWVSNFLLVIVGFGQIWLLKRTWDEVHAQAGQMASQTTILQNSLKAAQDAAEAAMAGQRAFVSTTPYATPDPKFGVVLRNVGNLPTIRLRNYIGYRLTEGELPADFVFPDDADPITQGTMLVPNQEILGPHIPRDGIISSADLRSIQQEIKNLYFFGWVKYFDGFPGTPERVTRFCFRLRVTGNPQQPYVYIPHSQHNCADEGCKEQERSGPN